jgi:hypothetical protein
VLFDEIKASLSGIGRFTHYRCFAKNELGDYDPSFASTKGNWLCSIQEGEFSEGQANGYQRQLTAYNAHCKLGYFLKGEPYGKYVEYDKDGKEWCPEGVYLSEKECVKKEHFESFEKNVAPETMVKYVNDEDLIPVNYHLKQTGDRLKNPNSTNQTSFAVSDVSDMTAKEAKIDEEYQLLIERQA